MKLKEFEDYLYDNYKSDKTIEAYKTDINQFLVWLNKDIALLENRDLRTYTKNLERACAVSTINRKIAAINQYIVFLNEKYNQKIVVRGKQLKVATQQFIDGMLENSHVRRMIKYAEQENDIRAIAVIYTLFYTGARVSEVLDLNLKDVDNISPMILGKGNKYRELLIPKKLKIQLDRYVKVRHASDSEKLFVGTRGPITRQTINRMLSKYSGKARINKQWVHPHAFRHLYAQNISKLGVPNEVIKQLLGHSLGVTDRYTQRSKKELLKIISKIDISNDLDE